MYSVGIPLNFESGRDECRGEDIRECSGQPRDLCESFELSIAQIGLETYRRYESRAKRTSRSVEGALLDSGILRKGLRAIYIYRCFETHTQDAETVWWRGGPTTTTRAQVRCECERAVASDALARAIKRRLVGYSFPSLTAAALRREKKEFGRALFVRLDTRSPSRIRICCFPSEKGRRLRAGCACAPERA